MKPNFVGQIRINTTTTTIDVEWDAPYHYPNTEKYIVMLRNANNRKIKNTRQVIGENGEALQASYADLKEGGEYKVAIRGIVEGKKGRWLVATVTLGENPPALMDNHYMYQVAAGEETPSDAYGEPTRHVRLENGVWTPFDPAREYKINALWWWYQELDKYETACIDTEDALEDWREAHPDSPIDHPLLKHKYELACEGVDNVRKRIEEEEKEAEEEIAVRYPPEELTVNDVRWVQRPKLVAH